MYLNSTTKNFGVRIVPEVITNRLGKRDLIRPHNKYICLVYTNEQLRNIGKKIPTSPFLKTTLSVPTKKCHSHFLKTQILSTFNKYIQENIDFYGAE
jgi:hypothetical protein